MELSPEEKLHCEAALLPGERRAAAGETQSGDGCGGRVVAYPLRPIPVQVWG